MIREGEKMRNPKNILRHEFIGLPCEITEASNKSLVGVKGNVVDETMKTIVLDGKRIQKKGTTFRMNVSGTNVQIDGDVIIARPEDRIKKRFKKW